MNKGSLTIYLAGEEVILDRERVLFWKKEKMLIVSDLHLGKAGHFRKHGIPVPTEVHLHDLQRLAGLLKTYQPDRLLLLGDLFHSDFNEEWMDLLQFRKHHFSVDFLLVQGNHDVLRRELYQTSGIRVEPEWLQDPFHFTHDATDSKLYNISGHVHPGVRLLGYARQGLSLPCFFFKPNGGILPAFGNFTGTYKIRPTKGSRVFAVSDDQVIELV